MNQNHRPIFAAILCHSFWGVSFLASRTALDTALVIILLHFWIGREEGKAIDKEVSV